MRPGDNVMPGADVERDHGVGLRGGVDDAHEVDRLHVAAVRERHRRAAFFNILGSLRLLCGFFRQQPRDIGVEPGADPVDHIVGDDRLGEVVNEDDERGNADEHQHGPAGHRQIGHADSVFP